jgi:hypothetical protein
MRKVLLGIVLLLATAAPTHADTGLTDAVAAAFLTRTVDAGLHAIAHERVGELAACGCLEHDNARPGTAEVIAYNEGFADPVARVVIRWGASAGHSAILSDPGYGRIGCAELVAGGRHWFACVLASGPLPAQPATGTVTMTGPAPVLALPDTAMPAP